MIYLTNKEFLEQLKISKEQGQLTIEAVHSFILLTNRLSSKMHYKNEMDREDCCSRAVEEFLKYWKGFDASKSQNPFSYFTQMSKNGFAKQWRELHNDMPATAFTRLSDKNSWIL